MPVRQPGAWGIDIGQCALKALRLENINGVATATAFDYVEHPKILSQPDADPDLLTREALEKFLARNSLKDDVVCMSVAGQSGLARFVKLPPVEERKISEIVKFEAKQQIPFPLEEVVWDFQKIGSGVVTDGFAMETEIGLFAIKRENVYRSLQHFQEVNVEVDVIQMSPLALCNYVSYDLLKKEADSPPTPADAKKLCVVALDIGVESSNLVVTDGERVIWQRPIPIGGNRFTRALTKDLKLTFAKAEHLKRNATKSPDLKRILLALRADLNEFVNEVQKSLHFFTNTHRDAQVQYMIGMGNAFRLPGLQKYLNEKLQLDVKKLGKFNRLVGDSVIAAPVFNDNVMTMPVVYGLALQGLKFARIHTNLLPQEIRTERLVRSKKPWAVGAAACLLLGVGGYTFGLHLERDAVASPSIADAKSSAEKGAINHAEATRRDFEEKVKQVDTLKKSIRSIVAGQDERLNWLKLQKFVNDCLPRLDGENIKGKAREQWWDKGGKLAFEKFKARQAVPKTELAGGEEGLDDLLQINLEAVQAVYTDALDVYFNRLRDSAKDLDSMPEEDKKVPPTGGGWVVEVRGFTYHQGQRQFVVDTLLDNLATLAPKGPAPKKGELPDPINGKVTHPVLYRFQANDAPVAGQFNQIDKSDLYYLVSGHALGKEKKPDLAPGAKPTSAEQLVGRLRDGWQPLGMSKAEFAPRDEDGRHKLLAGGGKDPIKKTEGQYPRTEFIVLFIWREPTFDDDTTAAPPGGGNPGR